LKSSWPIIVGFEPVNTTTGLLKVSAKELDCRSAQIATSTKKGRLQKVQNVFGRRMEYEAKPPRGTIRYHAGKRGRRRFYVLVLSGYVEFLLTVIGHSGRRLID